MLQYNSLCKVKKSKRKLSILSIVVATVITIISAGCAEKEKPPILSSIEVTVQPTKTTYLIGETFAPEGMKVTATYIDNSTSEVKTDDLRFAYDFSTAGNKTVTVTYEGKTASVTGITVIAPEATLVSIAVTMQPTKKTYFIDEPFDPAGMEVTATYSDNSTAPVTVTANMLAYDFSTAGTNKTVTVTFTYRGVTKTADVTGITVEDVSLASIEVTGQPTKNVYTVGEKFDPAGMEVTATYSDATTKTVPLAELEFDYDFSTAGTNKTVTITYREKTTTVTGINVFTTFSGEGTAEKPYLINTVDDLTQFAAEVNAGDDKKGVYYQLTADIDLSPNSLTKSVTGWTPIGRNFDNPFRGHWDGNGYIVENLIIWNSEVYTGFFGYVSGGSIKNQGINGVDIIGANVTGALAGRVSMSCRI